MAFRYTPTPTSSVSPTISLTPSITPSYTPTGTVCPGLTPTATRTNTPTMTQTPSQTPEPPSCCFSSSTTNYSGNTGVGTIDFFNDGSLFIGGTGNWFGSATTQHSRFNICGGLPITALTSSCTGGVTNSRGNSLLDYQSNGKYITTNIGRGVNRLNADFTNDTTFNGSRPSGTDALFQYMRGLYVNPSNEIFVIGLITGMTNCISGGSVSFNSGIYKLTSGGTIDTSYSGISLVFSAVPFSNENNITSNNDPSGKVLVAQTNSFTGNTTWKNLFRLNTNGLPDPTFDTSLWSGYTNDAVLCSYALPNGQYLIGGSFTNVSGITTQDQLVRLNNNGTLDTTFSYTGNTTISDIDIDTYGNIYTIGVSGVSSFISKLTSNGRVITTRTLIQKTGFPVAQIAVNRGDVYVGGSYSYNDGVTTWQGLTKWNLNLNLNMCSPISITPTPTPTITKTPSSTPAPACAIYKINNNTFFDVNWTALICDSETSTGGLIPANTIGYTTCIQIGTLGYTGTPIITIDAYC